MASRVVGPGPVWEEDIEVLELNTGEDSILQQGGAFMKPIQYLGVALLLLAGCQGTPTVTRSGDVNDIIVGDNLTSGEVAVSPGDEVRWVNKRTAPVRIVFLDPLSDKQLSCKNNFGGLMTPSDTAKLATNESASVCFRDPGYYRYTVRMESARTTGELNVSGVVKVGGHGGRAAGQQTSDQDRARTSGQSSDQNNDQAGDQTGGPRRTTSVTTSTTTTTEEIRVPTKPPQ
jgi:plastocyanin